MPLSFIAELVLQPVLEGGVQLGAYLTSRALVPVLSLGRAHVEPVLKGTRVKFRWHGFARGPDGRIVIHCDMGALLGLVFWLLAGAAVALLLHTGSLKCG